MQQVEAPYEPVVSPVVVMVRPGNCQSPVSRRSDASNADQLCVGRKAMKQISFGNGYRGSWEKLRPEPQVGSGVHTLEPYFCRPSTQLGAVRRQ